MSKIGEFKENIGMDNFINDSNDNDNDKDVVTLKQFLDDQRRIEIAAAEALPFKFDECTWKFGPIRQNLHICVTCPNLGENTTNEKSIKAFCYSCAVSCHNFDPEYTDKAVTPGSSNHSIEEIWTRRNFRCDCPSTGSCRLVSSSEVENDSISHENSYHNAHNFKGRYCFCDGPGWAAGDRTMYQCEICEDWYHDECVVRRAGLSPDHIPPEDSFEDFVCCECVKEKRDFFDILRLNELIFSFQNVRAVQYPHSLFLKTNWRQSIQKQVEQNPSLKEKASLLLIDHFVAIQEEPIFNPEEDSDASQTIYDLGLKALENSIPREQAIFGIQVIDGLKERLQSFLEIISTEDDSRPITAEDIESFFSKEEEVYQLKKHKRQAGSNR